MLAPFLIFSSRNVNEKLVTSKKVLHRKAKIQNYPQAEKSATVHWRISPLSTEYARVL